MKIISQFLEVKATDPDDFRRGRLLNILLFGVTITVLASIFIAAIYNLSGLFPRENSFNLYRSGFGMLIGLGIIFIIQRYWSIKIAATAFMLFMLIAIAFSDEPAAVVNGRSFFMFVIPVLLSSVILPPYTSFIAVALSGAIISFIAIKIQVVPNIVGSFILLLIAFISWLSANSLERALRDLSKINKELIKSNERLKSEVTERKRAEVALAEQAQVLSRTNAELQQFVYVSTHDLREPLRKVRSYTELLERRYKGRLDEKADKYIEYVVNGAKRMQVLITDLLTYLSVGEKESSLQATDLNLVLDKVLQDLALLVEENTAVITHDLLPIIQANSSQMTHLFQNLVSNAIKFRREKPPVIHIGVKKKDDEWLFSVADNGIGIDSQYHERIFIIFQRLHTKEAYPGTGIGLSICKKLVENHNGRIWLTSSLGQGTTFYFALPV